MMEGRGSTHPDTRSPWTANTSRVRPVAVRLVVVERRPALLSQRLVRNRVPVCVGVDSLLDWNYEAAYGFRQAECFV